MTIPEPEATRYFVRATVTGPPTVLRRVGVVDEAWAGTEWVPTKAVIDWMFGHDDNVDEVGPAVARVTAPAAFEPPVPNREAPVTAPGRVPDAREPEIDPVLPRQPVNPPTVMRKIGHDDEAWVGGKGGCRRG